MMFSVKNPNLNSILIVMLQSQIGIYLRPKIFLSKFPDTSKSDYKKNSGATKPCNNMQVEGPTELQDIIYR